MNGDSSEGLRKSKSYVTVLKDLKPGYPKFMSMFYAAEVDGQYMCFTETENLPTFRGIAEMNPVETQSAAARRAPAKSGSMIKSVTGLRFR